MTIIEMFEPYMAFISFFITILLNVWLISKKVDWIILLIGNLIIILVFQFFGLSEYNLLNKIIEWLLDFIGNLLKGIWDATLGKVFDGIKGFFEKIANWFD